MGCLTVVTEQEMINWAVGAIGTMMGVFLTKIWGAIVSLQNTDTEMAKELSEIKVLVAGSYVTREENFRLHTMLLTKLEAIDQKLDTKVDKH